MAWPSGKEQGLQGAWQSYSPDTDRELVRSLLNLRLVFIHSLEWLCSSGEWLDFLPDKYSLHPWCYCSICFSTGNAQHVTSPECEFLFTRLFSVTHCNAKMCLGDRRGIGRTKRSPTTAALVEGCSVLCGSVWRGIRTVSFFLSSARIHAGSGPNCWAASHSQVGIISLLCDTIYSSKNSLCS